MVLVGCYLMIFLVHSGNQVDLWHGCHEKELSKSHFEFQGVRAPTTQQLATGTQIQQNHGAQRATGLGAPRGNCGGSFGRSCP